jgi:adenosylcobinamide-phosphate synthase
MLSTRRWARRAGAVAIGLAVDGLVGEPPARLHPVARYGQAMERIERRWWRDDRWRGAGYASAGIGTAILVGAAADTLLGPTGALVAVTATAVAGRSLLTTAALVGALLEAGDLPGARALLPSLVGRDPAGLDDKEMARAVVESVAENLSDAVVATAAWGLLAGAPGALAHRAVNTMDAMVGHRSARYRRFGWAAARVDDLMGWPAARLTAVLVAAAVPARAGAVWVAVRRDAPAHPSPNAGVAEAAFAGALGLRLGGANRYGDRVEVRPFLGGGRAPEVPDVAAAVALARRALLLLTGSMAVVAGAGALATAAGGRRRSPSAQGSTGRASPRERLRTVTRLTDHGDARCA